MNREIISKELLSLVLGDEYNERLVETISVNIEENILETHYDCGKGTPTCLGLEINLDTFGRLCKEYVNNVSDYMVWSTTNMAKLKDLNNGKYIDKLFSGNTELEAIIKATKWVVEDV